MVAGRPHGEVSKMKPNPWLLELATRRLNRAPQQAIRIGDSATDVQAAHALGIPCIGLAIKPGKREGLVAADATVDSMLEVIGLLAEP
jgi:phosphoglycolate phosphatase-like HAD superfamily hydrolase